MEQEERRKRDKTGEKGREDSGGRGASSFCGLIKA